MYKIKNSLAGDNMQYVICLFDGACIPFDPANMDYQAYLAWVEAGNQPLPADE